MSSTTNPSQEIIDQFVGNAHGNLSVVKDLLERFPTLINANASWSETAVQAATQPVRWISLIIYLSMVRSMISVLLLCLVIWIK